MGLRQEIGAGRETARAGFRALLGTLLQATTAAGACALWIGLAVPSLQLLPGATAARSGAVSISLQSALLGIDDHGTHGDKSVRAALRALGLDPDALVPSSRLLAPSSGDGAPSVVKLAAGLRALDASRLTIADTVTPAAPAPPAATAAAAAPRSTPPRLHGGGSANAGPSAGRERSPAPSPSTGGGDDTGSPTQTPPPVPEPQPKAQQAISFGSAPPADAVVGGPAYVVAASATSGLPVVLSIDRTSNGVCAIAGTLVSFVGAGTCVVDANQDGDDSFVAAPQVQQTFAVRVRATGGGGGSSRSVQSIVFTSTSPTYAVLGGSYAVTATASSRLAVSFTVDDGSYGVCTVFGTLVAFDGPGTCTVVASQGGNASYAPARSVTQAFVVHRQAQTIAFTSTPPASAAPGGAAYTVSAAATSGLPVGFSADASSAGVCTVAGSTVTPVGPGTCVVDADQSGDAAHDPAPRVQQSFSVGGGAASKSVQSITFTSSPPSAPVIGGTYDVSAAASSGLPVVFSIDAASSGVCTLSGSTVTFAAVGTCTVDADAAGDASYLAAPQAQQALSVARRPQTISFTSSPPTGATVGGAAYVVGASASSGLAVAFSADASSAGVCTVSGSTVSFVGVGTCTVDADQSGNGTYAAAAQVQQTFFVSGAAKSTQTITYTSTAPASAAIGGSYVISAVASSGLAVSFSADASSAGVCTVSGSTVSFVGTGTCTVDADQPGDANYDAAAQAQQSFTVGRAAQTIAFTSSAPGSVNVGDPDYVVSATASSGLAVAFSTDASSAGVCTVSGSNVTFVGTGTCVVDADQSGNASYQPAPRAQQSFSVGGPPTKSVQSITFTSSAPSGAVIGGSYAVAASASSGLAVTFSVDASSAGVCTVSGSTVSFVAAGTCAVDADQAGDASYQPAPTAQQSFAVGRKGQAISFTSTPPSGATAGGATYAVAASSTSGLGVGFSIDSASSGVCTISGSTVTFTGGGTCTIDADQGGDATYDAAAQAQQSFAVAPATPPKSVQSITFTSSSPSGATVGATYAVSASASSGLPVAFSADASSAGVCTVSGSTVSLVGPGTCTVDANQAGDSTYDPAPQVQQSFAVTSAGQTITYTSTPPTSAAVGGATYTVSATASSGLPVTFTIDGSSGGVCTISGSTVTMVHAGTCTIDANQAGNASYGAAAQAQQSFTIARGSQTITFTSTPPSPVGQNSPPYTVSATASSGLSVTFTTDPFVSAGVCSVSGSTVTFLGKGWCVIYANQAGDADWLPASQQTQMFFVLAHA